jgi:hypothetical protein
MADGFMLLQNKHRTLQRMRIHAGSAQREREREKPLFEGSLKRGKRDHALNTKQPVFWDARYKRNDESINDSHEVQQSLFSVIRVAEFENL